MRASMLRCEARTPASSSRLVPASWRTSYHARMTMPPLIVTGCIGAWGKTKRTARPAGSPSTGGMSTKS